MARIKDLYYTQMLPALKQELGYANIMQVPRLTKIVINMGLGEAATNTKLLESSVEEIGLIAGQKPIVTRAHKTLQKRYTRGRNSRVSPARRSRNSQR